MTLQHYSTDSNERHSLTWMIALVSIPTATFLATHIPEQQVLGLSLKGLSSVFSSGLIFGAIYGVFNSFLWKLNTPLRMFGLVKIPDLNGTWQGVLKTSFNGFQSEHPNELHINQTWTRISVTMVGESSFSESTSAYMTVENNKCICLTYSFRNDPREDSIAHDTMASHKGLTTIVFDLETMKGTGNYFTNRATPNGKGTQGTFIVYLKKQTESTPPAIASFNSGKPLQKKIEEIKK